jgi:hypothetical protein
MVNKSDNDFIRIKEFVCQYLKVNKKKVNQNTRIEEDLGCTGDDARELIEAFSKEFSIDLRGFKFDAYFDEESSDIFEAVADHLLNKKKAKKSIRLYDMVEAARNGKWNFDN